MLCGRISQGSVILVLSVLFSFAQDVKKEKIVSFKSSETFSVYSISLENSHKLSDCVPNIKAEILTRYSVIRGSIASACSSMHSFHIHISNNTTTFRTHQIILNYPYFPEPVLEPFPY